MQEHRKKDKENRDILGLQCPKCSSMMILRIAKKGSNTGNKFYGCSRYPTCKETVPFELMEIEPTTSEVASSKEGQGSVDSYPKTLIARERFHNYQVQFFESVAVSEEVMKRIFLGEVDEEILKTFSQWRVDFPIIETKAPLTENQNQFLSVLMKILTRGRITLISPQLEEKFKKLFLKSQLSETIPLEGLLLKNYEKILKPFWFDSEEEKILYEHILPDIMGGSCRKWVFPQVEISSLIPLEIGTGIYQRVDFAIFHPKIDKKIIVEIDGKQHKRHTETDRQRDKILEEHGYYVLRIPADEIRMEKGPQLTTLYNELSSIKKQSSQNIIPNLDFFKFIHALKISHQIQLVLLQAIQARILNLESPNSWNITADLHKIGLFNKREGIIILKDSVADLFELIQKLGNLYSVKIDPGEPKCNLFLKDAQGKITNSIHIAFSDNFSKSSSTFHVQNIYFPFHIVNVLIPASPTKLNSPKKEDLEYFLQYIFRKPHFWEGQFEAISRTFEAKDSLVLLPTGAGKSLTFQLASLLVPGRTVVVEPIIALMEDQIDNLSAMGIDRAAAITSQMAEDPKKLKEIQVKTLQLLGQGEYLFIYITPERLQTIEFRQSLRELTVHTPIALIVVDEAHCVSEWGHDFRTAYLNIGRTSREYCKSNGYIPPLIGLTGTASRTVLKDVQHELQIDDFDAIITPKSFDRSELKFHILHSTSEEKSSQLKGLLRQKLPGYFNVTFSTFFQPRGKNTFSGLVFCPHVNGEFGVVNQEQTIRTELGVSTAFYSGKEPRFWSTTIYRQIKHRATKSFKQNEVPLMVCTKAFGMGIDKPNVRYTIHLNIPPSIESFYQEAGRAGRDRRTAHCLIISSINDSERAKKLLDPNTKVEDIASIIENISWEENDDITRVLYFHTNSFRGINQEKQHIEEVLQLMEDISKKGTKALVFSSLERETAEKAIHRLLLLGIISDYTINYSKNEFTVKLSGVTKEAIIESYGNYIANYLYSRRQNEVGKASQLLSSPLKAFVSGMIDLLLHFIYDVIERGRRRAFYEMWLACDSTFKAERDIFRHRILRYLEGEYSEDLEQLIRDTDIGISRMKDIFGSIYSPTDAAKLRGQVSRYLESYPDQPSLLMLRALTEIFSRDRDINVAKQNFTAAISSALTNYSLDKSLAFGFASWAISNIVSRDDKLAEDLIASILQNYPDRKVARELLKLLPRSKVGIPAWFILSSLQRDCQKLILKKGS